jgi:hypothetical protein
VGRLLRVAEVRRDDDRVLQPLGAKVPGEYFERVHVIGLAR